MVRISFAAAILVALFTVPGPVALAADSANKELTKLKKELEQVAKDAGKYAVELNKTMKSLEAIKTAEPKNLAKAYKSFQKDANNLGKAFKKASTGVNSLKAKRDQYLTAWEKASASISIPELKQASEERRKEVSGAYAKLTEETAGLGDRIDAFAAKLGDLQKFLGSDLTVPAVSAATSTMDGVLEEGGVLASTVQGIASKLSAFAGGL